MNRQRRQVRIQPLPQVEEGFSPRRGLVIFLFMLFGGGPIIVGLSYLSSSSASFSLMGTLVFIIGFAIVSGIIGLWTDKLPF